MNLPNKLTVLRMCMVPVFIVFVLLGGAFRYWSAAIFILAALTDLADGKIARKYNLVTNFGKIMDPLADKLLVTSALVCLCELGEVPGWMVIVILAREFIITGLRSVAAGEGIIIAAAKSGKIKTVLQMVALSAILLNNWPVALLVDWPLGTWLLWAAVAMTVYSGIEYIWKNKQVFRQ